MSTDERIARFDPRTGAEFAVPWSDPSFLSIWGDSSWNFDPYTGEAFVIPETPGERRARPEGEENRAKKIHGHEPDAFYEIDPNERAFWSTQPSPPQPRLVYLASPYSHSDPAVMEERYQKTIAAAAHLMKTGMVVFAPIVHSHEIGKRLGKQAGGAIDPNTHEFWMHQDLPILKRCDQLIVLTLEGWRESKGVTEEIQFAKDNNIFVTYFAPAVLDFLELADGNVVKADPRGRVPSFVPTPGENDEVENHPLAARATFPSPWAKPFAPLPVRQAAPDSKPTNPKDLIGVRKAPLSPVPGNVIAEIGLGMLEGASKYGRHNYRAVGVRASVYYDAVMRHLISWWEGEDIDADSGMSHVTKAITALVVLRDSMLRGNWADDRPPVAKPFYEDLNRRAGEILDKYQDRNPKHYTKEDVL